MALARVLADLNRPEDARREAEKGLALARTAQDQANARGMLDFLSQSQQAAARQASAQASHAVDNARVEACRGGDATACGQLVPSYERACGEDNAQACATLASFHEQGKGVPRDFQRAAAFYMMACNLGEQRACLAQAALQSEGRGLPRSGAQAMANTV